MWLSAVIGSMSMCETMIPKVANIPPQQNNSFFLNLTRCPNYPSYGKIRMLLGGKGLARANDTVLAGCPVRSGTADRQTTCAKWGSPQLSFVSPLASRLLALRSAIASLRLLRAIGSISSADNIISMTAHGHSW